MEFKNEQKHIKIDEIFLNIKKLYSKYKIPLINGVITKYKYVKININENKMITFIENDFDKNISLSEEYCSDIDILNKITYNNFIIYCGEGSYGGDGFITIMNKNNDILWIMFHEEINPIENIKIVDNKIIGINNCNIKYEFNIKWDELNKE